MRCLTEYNPRTDRNRVIPVPAGLWERFIFALSVTTDTSDAIPASDDIANFLLTLQGEQIVNASWTMLHILNQRISGAPPHIAPTAGASFLGLSIPATPDAQALPNSYFVERDGALTIQVNIGADFIADTAASTDALMQVYAVPSLHPAIFVPKIHVITQAMVAGANVVDVPSINNVMDLIIRASAVAQADRVVVFSGGKAVIEASWFALWTLANLRDRIEIGEVFADDTLAATPNYVHVVPAVSRTVAALASSSFGLQINTAGTATMNVLLFAAKFLGDNAYKTRQMVAAELVNSIRKLPTNERTKAIKAIKAAAGRTRAEAVAESTALFGS